MKKLRTKVTTAAKKKDANPLSAAAVVGYLDASSDELNILAERYRSTDPALANRLECYALFMGDAAFLIERLTGTVAVKIAPLNRNTGGETLLVNLEFLSTIKENAVVIKQGRDSQ